MFDKKKANDTKDRIIKMYRDRPLEMIFVTATALGAIGKVMHSVTEARNSSTWRREVKRREQQLKND